MQWIVLCGIPYRGSGALASPDPTNVFHYLSFPLPTLRAGPKATGRLYCLLQLFESNTDHSHLQAVRTANLLARLQLSENSNERDGMQARSCGKCLLSVGNSNYARLYWRGIMPRSVRPFTKNCMARATSNNPMTLTRIRMPVSRITRRTPSAPARTK